MFRSQRDLRILDRWQNFLDASHLPILQADLDAMWMIRGFREEIFNDPFGQFSGALVLFQNNKHDHAGFDVNAGLSI